MSALTELRRSLRIEDLRCSTPPPVSGTCVSASASGASAGASSREGESSLPGVLASSPGVLVSSPGELGVEAAVPCARAEEGVRERVVVRELAFAWRARSTRRWRHGVEARGRVHTLPSVATGGGGGGGGGTVLSAGGGSGLIGSTPSPTFEPIWTATLSVGLCAALEPTRPRIYVRGGRASAAAAAPPPPRI